DLVTPTRVQIVRAGAQVRRNDDVSGYRHELARRESADRRRHRLLAEVVEKASGHRSEAPPRNAFERRRRTQGTGIELPERPRGRLRREDEARLLALAECCRDHGLASF